MIRAERTCRSCAHMVAEDNMLRCRRYPPVWTTSFSGVFQWPRMRPQDWCGEHATAGVSSVDCDRAAQEIKA